MYKRLGGGYLQDGGEVNRRYDPADNELYIIVRRLTALVGMMNKRLHALESQEEVRIAEIYEMKKQLAACERKLLEASVEITEIPESREPGLPQIEYPGGSDPQTERTPFFDNDKEEECPEVIFGGSLEASSDAESHLDLESQVLGASEPKALSKRLSEGFWTSCSKLKNLIVPTATFGSQEICSSDLGSPSESVPMLVFLQKDDPTQES